MPRRATGSLHAELKHDDDIAAKRANTRLDDIDCGCVWDSTPARPEKVAWPAKVRQRCLTTYPPHGWPVGNMRPASFFWGPVLPTHGGSLSRSTKKRTSPPFSDRPCHVVCSLSLLQCEAAAGGGEQTRHSIEARAPAKRCPRTGNEERPGPLLLCDLTLCGLPPSHKQMYQGSFKDEGGRGKGAPVSRLTHTTRGTRQRT